jgi:succinyl-diaminopimelate desuccinylase
MSHIPAERLKAYVQKYQADMISFCQRLIQVPSSPGEEENLVHLIEAEMGRLGYDQVWHDEWGNAIGMMRGQGKGHSVLFDGHMDHAFPGNIDHWRYPPFGGEIHDGRLWGLGAADMKGSLGALIHAVGVLAREGIRPPGDIYVAATVQEEVGGLGTARLLNSLRPDCAVVGESTSGQMARGHRGRTQLVAKVRGRSAHASTPQLGVNPHAVIARLVQRLETMSMPSHAEFGVSSLTPTLIFSDKQTGNIIPGEISLHLDLRTVPGRAAEEVLVKLDALLQSCLAEVPGSQGQIEIPQQLLRTWTGRTEIFPYSLPSYSLDVHDTLVIRGQDILKQALGRPVETIFWSFATDAGHLAAAGVPTIGFGPGDFPKLHDMEENISIDQLIEGMLGYLALALELGEL